MGEGTADGSLRRAYEAMVSFDVVLFLRARGFDVIRPQLRAGTGTALRHDQLSGRLA